MKPTTLRKLAGLPTTPAPLSESVVLVVDAQKEYTEGLLPLSGINESITALAQFLDRARKLNTPVVHIVHKGAPGGKIMASDGSFFDIIDAVKPRSGEVVVEKKLPSSFKGTELKDILEQLGNKPLVVTGYMTHMCVNSTTRDAAEMGYAVTVVEELTATRDLPDMSGSAIPAEVVKASHLAGLADRFAIVVSKGTDIPD